VTPPPAPVYTPPPATVTPRPAVVRRSTPSRVQKRAVVKKKTEPAPAQAAARNQAALDDGPVPTLRAPSQASSTDTLLLVGGLTLVLLVVADTVFLTISRQRRSLKT
jgi:hypothetical protein